MVDKIDFIEDSHKRTQIDEFFAEELGHAGYGGMDVAKTPMGTQIVLKAEKPGMVIGKGGKNIQKITTELEERFDLDDPKIDVQEVDEPDLNARIVADRLANALERGWYFRKAGHTTIDRIMEAGALGAEIVLSGKITGARSRVEKFNRGYIKYNGEPAEEIVDSGVGVAVMKLGTIGVQVKIIPPDADLPDDFEIYEDADVEDYVADNEGESVKELLEGEPKEDTETAGVGHADPEDVGDNVNEDEIIEEDVELSEDESKGDKSEASIEKANQDYSNKSESSQHQKWLLKEPDEREEHPIDRIRKIQKIEPGDVCPLEDCKHEWESYKISIETEDQNESSLEKTFCSDPICPLSLRTPSRLSEYLKGEMERKGAQTFGGK